MKIRRWLALAVAALAILPLAACNLKPAASLPTLRDSVLQPGGQLVRGDGRVVTDRTAIPENERGYALRILGVSLRGSSEGDIRLEIAESLAPEVVLTTDSNIAVRAKVEIDEVLGEILIDLSRDVFTPSKLTIAVGAPIRRLELNGAWNFTYDCPSVTACDVDVNGACNGSFAFGALDSLRLRVNGASNLTLAGAARTADLTINGASSIKGFGLRTESADVTINGAGDCEITATAALNAAINGVGKIVYDGSPPVVNRPVRGLGEVRAR